MRGRIPAFVLLLPVLLSAQLAPAAACPPDAPRFVAHFARQIAESDNFFVVDDPVKRLAYLVPAARAALPALRDLANRGGRPTRYLALWAIARIAPDDPVIESAVNEAARKFNSRVFYELLTAAAFLSQAKGADSDDWVERFLAPIYEELRKLQSKDGQVFRRAMIAWVLYEIGTPEATARAEQLTRPFVDDPFADGSLLTGIDGVEVIGPHAKIAVPVLTDIVSGEYDGVSKFFYRDDAARALTIVGGEAAQWTVAQYLDEARHALLEPPSTVGKALDAVLDLSVDKRLAGQIADLTELLPYSHCAQAEIETILDGEDRAPEVTLSAAEFLIEAGSEVTPVLRQRLISIESHADDPDVRARAQRLMERL